MKIITPKFYQQLIFNSYLQALLITIKTNQLIDLMHLQEQLNTKRYFHF